MTKSIISKLKQASMAALVCYLSLVMLTGCGKLGVVAIKDPAPPVSFSSPVINRITLTVAVPPDKFKASGAARLNRSLEDGREEFQLGLASSLKNSLTTSGAAKSVSTYPASGSWALSVTGKWDAGESWSEVTWRAIKTTFAFVLFLGIPIFFMSSSSTVKTEAEVILTDSSGVERGRSRVESTLDIEVSMIQVNTELFDEISAAISDELANRILLEMKRHPHWFEAAQ
jgi:hypothetical protein